MVSVDPSSREGSLSIKLTTKHNVGPHVSSRLRPISTSNNKYDGEQRTHAHLIVNSTRNGSPTTGSRVSITYTHTHSLILLLFCARVSFAWARLNTRMGAHSIASRFARIGRALSRARVCFSTALERLNTTVLQTFVFVSLCMV